MGRLENPHFLEYEAEGSDHDNLTCLYLFLAGKIVGAGPTRDLSWAAELMLISLGLMVNHLTNRPRNSKQQLRVGLEILWEVILLGVA